MASALKGAQASALKGAQEAELFKASNVQDTLFMPELVGPLLPVSCSLLPDCVLP